MFIKQMSRSHFKDAFWFYSHTKERPEYEAKGIDGRIFSNLYPCTIVIDSKSYSSTETYFQQFKYSEGDKNFICALPKTNDIAAFGQRRLTFKKPHLKIIESLKEQNLAIPLNPAGEPYKLNEKASPKVVLANWDTDKIAVMYAALKAKFTQHENLREILFRTEEMWLIEHTTNDAQWADGGNGNGKNYLGKLIMQLRYELKNNPELFTQSVSYDKEKLINFDFGYLNTPMKDLIDYDEQTV